MSVEVAKEALLDLVYRYGGSNALAIAIDQTNRLVEEVRAEERQAPKAAPKILAMRLASGGLFYPGDLDHGDRPTLEDVAEGLSKESRFAGQLPGVLYSVAQHSVLGSYLVDPAYARDFLFHDVDEWCLKDLPTPVKVLCPDYKALQDRVLRWHAKIFNFRMPGSEVHRVDAFMLKFEQAMFRGQGEITNAMMDAMGAFRGPSGVWAPSYAFDLFMRRERELRP